MKEKPFWLRDIEWRHCKGKNGPKDPGEGDQKSQGKGEKN